MHTPPLLHYNGLTLLLDKPSRLDKDKLLTGIAATFIEECIAPYQLTECDIRDTTVTTPLLPKTTHIALLGKGAWNKYPLARPGYAFTQQAIRYMAAYYPQDCLDHRNIEYSGSSDDDNQIAESALKDDYPTKRSNYRFWTKYFLGKLLRTALPVTRVESIPFPRSAEIIKVLNSIRDTSLYLDIETSRLHRCITCIGISSPALFPKVYVIPVYLPGGELAYGKEWFGIYKALSLALLANTCVAHNAMFDLLIMHAWYKFPLPPHVYDTMLANHRLYPEAEKSLSHVIAMHTEQPYHKDTNTEVFDMRSAQRMWEYNANDVLNLHLIKQEQDKISFSNPGLQSSITQANSMIIPYLVTTITGLRLDLLSLATTEKAITRARNQWLRVCQALTNIKDFNPGSAKQCASFFHTKLNYAISARTATGAPEMGTKQLYQLALKYRNPLIPFIIAYRREAKDLSMLSSELFSLP